jgi:pimeloyl-ACP methyl ester carboxylesterase
MTSIGHSRKMAARMPSAALVEVPGGGHMVILEKKDRVNAALDQLFAAAAASPTARVS